VRKLEEATATFALHVLDAMPFEQAHDAIHQPIRDVDPRQDAIATEPGRRAARIHMNPLAPRQDKSPFMHGVSPELPRDARARRTAARSCGR